MTTDPQWTPCEPGTLANLKQSTDARTSQLTRRGALAAVAVAAAGGGMLLLRDEGPGGISCTELKQLAQDYVAGTLETQKSQQIDAHREKCSPCHAKLLQLEEAKEQSA